MELNGEEKKSGHLLTQQGSALGRELNERRARFPLGLSSPYVDPQSSSSCIEQVLARAFKKRHVHVPTCTWRTWHVVTHVEETHTESHKKIWADSVNGSHRNSTLKLLLSCKCVASLVEARCKFQGGQTDKQTNKNPPRLVERVRLAARSLKTTKYNFLLM